MMMDDVMHKIDLSYGYGYSEASIRRAADATK